MGPGVKINGRYQLEDRIGRGGVGEVWRAKDLRLHRQVAIKILLSRMRPNHQAIARLKHEAEIQAAAAGKHPGIAAIHDIGEFDGQMFVVMEYLEGRDLKKVLDDAPNGLPVDQALSMAIQIAQALAAAHASDIVHRDIKPANLMLLPDERVKILDFGIARFAQATSGLTSEGHVVGTPAYMAPEQWSAQPVDERADLYSFGCVLYALLTGRPPFAPDQAPGVLGVQHRESSPRSPGSLRSGIPPALDDLVTRLLAKSPHDRPRNAEAVGEELSAIRGGDGTPPAPRRRVGCAVQFAVGTLAMLMFAGGLAAMLDTDDAPRPTSRSLPSPPFTPITPPTAGSPGTLIPGDGTAFPPDGDVTIPDGTTVTANQVFKKTWKIQNSGSVPWRGRFLTRQGPAEGPGLCASVPQVRVPDTAPGKFALISVTFTAPDLPGSCRVDWKLTDAKGRPYFPNHEGVYVLVRVAEAP
ncbi:protein kinase domain-containing protein [Actinomadura spongiicola]|nr:protein kinase [Actinomadura spongiicola]